MIVTKEFRTRFKRLTLGVSKLERVRRRPDVVPVAQRPGPNLLAQPELWLDDSTLHFDEASGALAFVHIYDLGFRDINGIEIGGPWSQVSQLAGKRVRATFYVDERKGVIYWDDSGRGTVTKIVYVSQLRIRTS